MKEGKLLQELIDRIKELEKENERLKGYREAYGNIMSDIYHMRYESSEMQEIIERYEMDYRFLTPGF